MLSIQPGTFPPFGYYLVSSTAHTSFNQNSSRPIDFSADLEFNKIKNHSEMLLEPEPSKYQFPPIILNLGHLATYLSITLPLKDSENDVIFVKDTAAQVIGGPLSTSWQLLVVLNGFSDKQDWKNSCKKPILDALKNYLIDRIRDVSQKDLPFGPMLLKSVYKLRMQNTSYGFCYEFGPRATIYFSSNPYRPMNASSLDGLQISLSGNGRFIVGNRILPSAEIDVELMNVRKRNFMAINVPGLFIPMLRHLGNGASLICSDHAFMKGQLESMNPIEMQKLWKSFQLQQNCLRTKTIHFLNFLLLAQNPSLCKKVAELGASTFENPGLLAFAHFIQQNPHLAQDLLHILHVLCLDQYMRPNQNKILHIFGMLFDLLQNPRPYAAFSCGAGIRYLALAAPNEKDSPEDILLRFFESIRALSHRSLLNPILDVLGLDPLEEDQNGIRLVQGLISNWDKPFMKSLMALHYPHRNFLAPSSLMEIYQQMIPKDPIPLRIFKVSQENAIVPKTPTPQHEIKDSLSEEPPELIKTSSLEDNSQEDNSSPLKFILLLNALSRGALPTSNEWTSARNQLLDMLDGHSDTLREAWLSHLLENETCPRTQLIRLLNSLQLAKIDPTICQKMLKLLLEMQKENDLVGKEFIQVLFKNPEMAAVLLPWIQGVCLYTWATQGNQSQNELTHHCPYAQFACEQEILHLALSTPDEKDSPEEVALRFFKSMESLSKLKEGSRVQLASMQPILAILELSPLADEGAKQMTEVMEEIVNAWQQPKMKRLLQEHFPLSRPIYRPLTNRLKKQKRILTKAQYVASPIKQNLVQTKTPRILFNHKILPQGLKLESIHSLLDNEERKVPPNFIPENELRIQENHSLLQQWKKLVQDAQAGNLAACERIATQMIGAWPAVSKITDEAQNEFIDVLLRSKSLEHFKRALSIASKTKQPICKFTQKAMLKAMLRQSAEEWTEKLAEKAGIFLKSICEELPLSEDSVLDILQFLRAFPDQKLDYLTSYFFEGSLFPLALSLPHHESLSIFVFLTTSSIQNSHWLSAVKYQDWAKSHLTQQNHETFLETIKSQLKRNLQLRDIINKKAAPEKIKQTLNTATAILSLYHALDPVEANKMVKVIFKHAFECEEESFLQELLLLYQAAIEFGVFPENDKETRRHHCYELIIKFCNSPINDSFPQAINWLEELKLHSDLSDEHHVSCLSQANFLYMKRLVQQVLMCPKGEIDFAVTTLKDHFKTQWIPFVNACKESPEIAFKNTHRICVHAIFMPYYSRALHQAMKNERMKKAAPISGKDEELLSLISKYPQLINKRPYTLVTKEEKLEVLKEAYKMIVGVAKCQYDQLCSFDGSEALVPLIEDILVSEAYIAQQMVNDYKDHPTTANKVLAEHSTTCCFRLLESVKVCWKELTNKEIVAIVREKKKRLAAVIGALVLHIDAAGGIVRIGSHQFKRISERDDDEK